MTKLETLIAELERLDKERTPGPWRSDSCGDVFTEAEKEYCPGFDQWLFRTIGTTKCGPDPGDAAFIAKAANSIPTLIKVIKVQREALMEIEAQKNMTLLGTCCVDTLTIDPTCVPLEGHKCTHQHGVNRGFSKAAAKAQEGLTQTEALAAKVMEIK